MRHDAQMNPFTHWPRPGILARSRPSRLLALGTLGLMAALGPCTMVQAAKAKPAAPAPTGPERCEASGGREVIWTLRTPLKEPARAQFDQRGRLPACEWRAADGSKLGLSMRTLAAVQAPQAVKAWLKPVAFDAKGGGSPAAHYCYQIGGTSTTIVHWGARGAAAGEMGLCLFADGSAIDDWALFYKQGGDLRGMDLATLWPEKS